MPTLSTRALTALVALERGEQIDPALTLPTPGLTEDLAPVAGARPLPCEPSPAERRRWRERARRDACASERSERAPRDELRALLRAARER